MVGDTFFVAANVDPRSINQFVNRGGVSGFRWGNRTTFGGAATPRLINWGLMKSGVNNMAFSRQNEVLGVVPISIQRIHQPGLMNGFTEGKPTGSLHGTGQASREELEALAAVLQVRLSDLLVTPLEDAEEAGVEREKEKSAEPMVGAAQN